MSMQANRVSSSFIASLAVVVSLAIFCTQTLAKPRSDNEWNQLDEVMRNTEHDATNKPASEHHDQQQQQADPITIGQPVVASAEPTRKRHPHDIRIDSLLEQVQLIPTELESIGSKLCAAWHQFKDLLSIKRPKFGCKLLKHFPIISCPPDEQDQAKEEEEEEEAPNSLEVERPIQ